MAPISPAEANRLYYAETAEQYNSEERCANLPILRDWLRSMIERAAALLDGNPEILDLGGGAGNAAELLTDLGVEPLVVDISPQMLSIWQAKARARGRVPRTVLADIDAFISSDGRSWDLIVLSSVLHHLIDPTATLDAVALRVKPGGMILTAFDPLPADGIDRFLGRSDYALWLARHRPLHFGRAVSRRLRTRFVGSSEPNLGALAEVHAFTGVPCSEMIRNLRRQGFEILAYEQRIDARCRPLGLLRQWLRRPTTFSLLARRMSQPSPQSQAATADADRAG
jgi:SAM-dependent methyltransferase